MLCIEFKLFQSFFDILRCMVKYQNQFFKFEDLPNKGAYIPGLSPPFSIWKKENHLNHGKL
jgi:hypothetical protein